MSNTSYTFDTLSFCNYSPSTLESPQGCRHERVTLKKLASPSDVSRELGTRRLFHSRDALNSNTPTPRNSPRHRRGIYYAVHKGVNLAFQGNSITGGA